MARILYIEDQALIAWDTSQQLETAGHVLTYLRSAQQGLELLYNGAEFDVIVTDNDTGSGAQGIDIAKAFPSHRIPVIIVSGDGAEVAEEAKANNAWFFQKPIPIMKVLDKITEIMENKQAPERILSP